MTPEEHQAEHVRLHRAFDELLGCYLSEGFAREDAGGKRGSIYDLIYDLMTWSHHKTLFPSSAERGHYASLPQFLIAQNDDPELLEWLAKAEQDGGGFVQSIANAGLRADAENYPLIRTLLLVMRKKYPRYEPSDAVKEEIRNRARDKQDGGQGPGSPSPEEGNT